MTDQYIEYGIKIAHGPHRGMLVYKARSMEAVQRWLDNPPSEHAGRWYTVHQRQVWATDWVAVPHDQEVQP